MCFDGESLEFRYQDKRSEDSVELGRTYPGEMDHCAVRILP